MGGQAQPMYPEEDVKERTEGYIKGGVWGWKRASNVRYTCTHICTHTQIHIYAYHMCDYTLPGNQGSNLPL